MPAKTTPTRAGHPEPLFSDGSTAELLTVNLTKVLECGHDRVDFSPNKLGDTVHCWMCPGLKMVKAVLFPPRQTVTDFDRIRLMQAGFTTAELRHMEAGQAVTR